jgi:membrane associated rhomboid family serine protease
MKLSDSQLTSKIWDLVHSESLRHDWKKTGDCPRCAKAMIGVPFRHSGKEHALIACSSCYMIAMKGPTLALFRESNPEFQAKRLADAQALAHAKLQHDLERDIETAKRLVQAGVDRADYLLNETPLREIRVTVLTALAACGLSVFTMLMPYTAMELFGNAAASSILSAFTHVTFFHLAWNLLFFLPLAAPTERDLGSIRFAATFGVILSLANGLGRILSPFPDAPLIGLSPLIAALLGRNLVLGVPFRIRSFTFESRTVAFVFLLSELRTLIPTSGGMKWFTLGACVVAGILSAAVAEWQRRRLVDSSTAPGGEVVLLRPSSSPAKRAA